MRHRNGFAKLMVPIIQTGVGTYHFKQESSLDYMVTAKCFALLIVCTYEGLLWGRLLVKDQPA
jgi:hypothetical protein